MTGVDERSFERLLRWYPRGWRRRHGAVLVATLLEEAEARGRRTPTAADVRSAAVHGMAAHLGRRFALVTSVLSVGAAVTAGALFVSTTPGLLVLVLLSGVVPTLATWSVVATSRVRGLVGDVRAIAVTALATASWSLGVMASVAWALGFDDAEAGRPLQGLAAAFLPLFGGGVVLGAAAIAIAVEAVLRRTTRVSAATRCALAVSLGLSAAPLIGLSSVGPAAAALFASGAVVFGVLPARLAVRAPRGAESLRGSAPAVPLVAARRRRVASRAAAWVAAAGGTTGLAYAFFGSAWSPAAPDGTIAMAHGITVLLVSAIPLLAAIGATIEPRPTFRSAIHRWGPLALVALSLCSVAAAYVAAPDSAAMQPGLQAGAILAGAALAWAISAHARLPRAAAVIVGVASGALYASFIGVMVAPLLAFGVPAAALFLALRPSGRRFRVLPRSRASAPVPVR